MKIAGTIKVGWAVAETDLLPKDYIECKAPVRRLTAEELSAFKERLEELLHNAFPDSIGIYIDGEDKPAVQVELEIALGLEDIEIDDGPFIGLLEHLDVEMTGE